jgi:hypothetical protein
MLLSTQTQFNSIQLNSTQFNSIQLNSTQFNSIQLNSTQFNSIQLNFLPKIPKNSSLYYDSKFPLNHSTNQKSLTKVTLFL